MPRKPAQKPPAYRLHKPTGKAIVTLDGRDFYLGPHGTKISKAEYDRLVGEWLANGRRLPPALAGDNGDLVVAQLMATYLDFAKTYYVKDGKPTSEYEASLLAFRPLRKLYGHTRVADFGPPPARQRVRAVPARMGFHAGRRRPDQCRASRPGNARPGQGEVFRQRPGRSRHGL